MQQKRFDKIRKLKYYILNVIKNNSTHTEQFKLVQTN